jgi:hypothetical protein
MKLRSLHLCSWHCAHRVYAEQCRAHSSTLPIFAAHLPVCRIHVVGRMPRTCLCTESVWWGGCRAPTAARVLQALRATRVPYIYSTHLSCRALACEQNPCGGVDAAHQPQRVCSRHCAHTVNRAAHIHLLYTCRALACVQNPCGGVDAAHHPQRVCSRHCAHRMYAEQGRTHTSTLYMPRTCLCAEFVWWGGCRAPSVARVLQALRAHAEQCRTHTSTLYMPRTCL